MSARKNSSSTATLDPPPKGYAEPTSYAAPHALDALRRDFEAADELALQHARGEGLTASEWILLERVHGSRRAAESACGRMRGLLSLARTAGTFDDRDAAHAAAKAAAEREAAEVPGIEEQIRALEQRRSVLTTARLDAEREVMRRDEAWDSLLRRAPEHIERTRNQQRVDAKREFKDVTHAESRLPQLRAILDLPTNVASAADVLQRRPGAVPFALAEFVGHQARELVGESFQQTPRIIGSVEVWDTPRTRTAWVSQEHWDEFRRRATVELASLTRLVAERGPMREEAVRLADHVRVVWAEGLVNHASSAP